MPSDRIFDLRSGQMWQITDAVLSTSAEEVYVADAAAPLRLGVDHAGGAVVLAAAVAVPQAF